MSQRTIEKLGDYFPLFMLLSCIMMSFIILHSVTLTGINLELMTYEWKILLWGEAISLLIFTTLTIISYIVKPNGEQLI